MTRIDFAGSFALDQPQMACWIGNFKMHMHVLLVVVVKLPSKTFSCGDGFSAISSSSLHAWFEQLSKKPVQQDLSPDQRQMACWIENFVKTLETFSSVFLGWALIQNQGLPCLTHYTVGSTIRSLEFTISSLGIAMWFKSKEKIPQFLCRGESSLHGTSWNLAPPTWVTMLVCVTSFQEVPRVEDFP